MGPHHWAEGVSSNPSDPRLIIDPWNGRIAPIGGKMKPIAYFPIFGFLISVLILAIITRWLPREKFEVVEYGLMAFGIGMGLVAGFTAQNKKYKILRPIQYWPLIGLVAAFFTKGGTWDDYWSSVFPFWIFLGFVIGLFFEWRKKTINRRT